MTRYFTVGPGGVIRPADDVMMWAEWMSSVDTKHPRGLPFMDGGRRVAWTDLPEGGCVSTVFLGIDHGSVIFPRSVPVLFETMIFAEGNPNDQYQERYSTHAEALAGHERAVALALAPLSSEVSG